MCNNQENEKKIIKKMGRGKRGKKNKRHLEKGKKNKRHLEKVRQIST